MAQTIVPILHVLGIVSVLLLIQKGTNAYEFKVGGPTGNWTVPSDSNAAIYNQWAEKNRFQIGDTLLFVYDSEHDSVLHVTKDDYTNCNTGVPLQKFTDGHTVFTFNQSGPCYFISGAADNCHKNEKLVVVVMADRTKHAPPSPAPEQSSSPPIAPSQESSPPTAPSQESSPKKNAAAASTTLSTILATIAAFTGSSVLLAMPI